MQKKAAFFIIGVILLLFASGCVRNCKPEDYASFVPILDSPSEGEVVSYDQIPTFSWHNNVGCKPKKYRIFVTNLFRGDFFIRDIDGDQNELSSADILDVFDPNRDMEWYLLAFGENQPDAFVSSTVQFRTDGLCEANELIAPLLNEPTDGYWNSRPGYRLKWFYPSDCVPEYFKYDVAADPGFSTIITSGLVDSYYVYDEPVIEYGQNFGKIVITASVQVPECARVYWRVKGMVGNQSGPFSETYRFTNAMDYSCWQNETSIDASLIKGYVFEDICENTQPWLPDGVGIWPPCTFSEEFGVYGDGNRSRGAYGEKGIPDVIVDLGAGPCPSTGLDQFSTMSNGMYYFMVQAPGEYCVSVSKLTNPDLEDGIWTEPLTGKDVTQQTLTFGPSELLKFQSFGWDDNNYIQIDFPLETLTTCRAGWSTNYPEVMYLEKGSIVPLIARNEENTWHLTEFGCWIYIGEDPGELPPGPELPPPPAPQPADQPKDDGKKDCSEFTDPGECPSDRCFWVVGAGPGGCVER